MKIIGITGSIGMGKSVTAQLCRRMGYPVFEADREVHKLLAHNKHVQENIRTHFPHAYDGGRINRRILGQHVFDKPDKLRLLESLIHPPLRACQAAFLARQQRAGRKIVICDIPLLYENHNPKDYDVICVVSCRDFIQRQRVLARPSMTYKKMQRILQLQLPDAEKKRRADIIIQTGLGQRFVIRQLHSLFSGLKADSITN